MPAIVEAEDSGLYVLKFRGAGQGPLALVAELISGEIGRALGLRVPELVLMELDASLGRNEPDQEIRDLLQASVGLNLAMDYLPGSVMFDSAAKTIPVIDSDIASSAVWFDSLITNVDRTVRNPNLLWWHKALYLIDHGASLYFHHNWQGQAEIQEGARSRFPAIREHVLLPWASSLEHVDAVLRARLNGHLFREILDQVPDLWLLPSSDSGTPEERRARYRAFFMARLESRGFVEEAINAHAKLL